jgi:hypothetical protein
MIRVVVRNLANLVVKTVMASSDDDIDNIKARIQDKFDIPTASQKLVLRTVELLSGERLHHYTRHEQGHELLLHLCDTRSMQVMLCTLSGRTCLLDAVPSLPARILKVRILSLDGMQFLSFD